MRGKTDGRSRLRRLPCVFLRCVHSRTNIKASCGSSGQNTQEAEAEGARRLRGTHFFGQQGDEVSLKLRLDHLHHMLHLCGLTAVNQLIQRQQLLWASPALEDRQRHTHTNTKREKIEIIQMTLLWRREPLNVAVSKSKPGSMGKKRPI